MIHAVECSCTLDTVYADGSKPSFYTDATKATYMWKKLRAKMLVGRGKADRELVVDPPYVQSTNGWEVRSRAEPRPLKEYDLYYGVHLNGLHVISIK